MGLGKNEIKDHLSLADADFGAKVRQYIKSGKKLENTQPIRDKDLLD